MSVFKRITEKPLWANILIAIGIVVVLILLFFLSLSYITKHNETIKVPSVIGKHIDEAVKLLEDEGFEVEVQDSVYIDSTAKLSVVKQTPDGGTLVKTNRTIFLTINRAEAPLIEMPDLRGYSFKSAELYLQSIGLKLGDTTFKPDFTRNVLDQLFNGRPIKPGTKVNMGSSIALVLGDGVGNAEMSVPDIVGMTFGQAKAYLQSMNISIGAVVPDGGLQDQENAFIYKQSPSPYSEPLPGQKVMNKIKAGQVIDVYLSATPPVKDTATTQPPAQIENDNQ